MTGILLAVIAFGSEASQLPTTVEPETRILTQYREFLQRLPEDQPAAITQAVGEYLISIAPLDVYIRTQAFLDFLNFHDAVCQSIEYISDNVSNRYDEIAQEQGWRAALNYLEQSDEVRELRRHGLEPHATSEGGFWIRGIPAYIPAVFGRHVTEDAQYFLELRQKELEEGYAYDASLAITFRQLTDRLITWENYIRTRPESPLCNDARLLRNEYLLMLMFGEANTDIMFTDEYPEHNVRPLYDELLTRFRDNVIAEVLGEHCRRLAAMHWKWPVDDQLGMIKGVEGRLSQRCGEIHPSTQLNYRPRPRNRD